jgi:hypothetical protein
MVMRSRTSSHNAVWGGLLILFGVVGLVDAFADVTAWGWVGVLMLAGLGVLGVYVTNRAEWAILIPAYVMWAVAGLVALVTLDVLRGAFVPTYVLAAFMLPFLVVYVRDREQWWSLIPAWVLLAVGLMVGLIGQGILRDLLIPAYVMFAIAIPFIVVYARNPSQWWALIPGGIMIVIGASFVVAEGMFQYVAAIVLLVVGTWILLRQFTRSAPMVKEDDVP